MASQFEPLVRIVLMNLRTGSQSPATSGAVVRPLYNPVSGRAGLQFPVGLGIFHGELLDKRDSYLNLTEPAAGQLQAFINFKQDST